MKRLLVSAAHKSSGKTTIAVGLCAALTARGLHVQPYKKGPDYIDPMWLAQASGHPCFNLDPYLQSQESITHAFVEHSHGADIHIVEGNKGLYDGLALDGSNSNAALAKMLGLPVVLVLDARGMTRGIAPLILGYQAFDPSIRIAGVILNQLGGSRHEAKLRAVIEHYTDVAVLGAVAHNPQLAVVERHLGLMPNNEVGDADARVQDIGAIIAAQVDLDRILQVASSASAMPASALPAYPPSTSKNSPKASTTILRIGIARDKAFGFYYPDDLLALQAAGAQLVPFDALQDSVLPPVDGLFIGGGFPEMFMPELAANAGLRESIRQQIEQGLPVYAECGGLMYLSRSITWKDQIHPMVGALPLDILMHPRPVGRGYIALRPTTNAAWHASPDVATGTVRGHEFHYSSAENVAPDLHYAYDVVRGHGIDGQRDGICFRNVVANYAHLRSATGSTWAENFVAFVRAQVGNAQNPVAPHERRLLVNGATVVTDSEGYLKNLADWSEDFAHARAAVEGLQLTDTHWEVLRYLRAYYEEHRAQAQVRTMIKHFCGLWGSERGNNHYLHSLFPIGGPQKQGNRLAGLLKTKGEH